MIGLVDKITRQCVALVENTDGHDLTLYDQVAGPIGNPVEWRWNIATESWIPRPLSIDEQAGIALDADTQWQALKAATPNQVETWLNNNVTDLASARRVLKILIFAIQKISR